MNQDQLFKDHDKLLRHLAYRNVGRLTQVGYCIDADELYGIFCEVFVVSLKTWDETKSKLTTYLTTACVNKVSQLLREYHKGDNRTECESVLIDRLSNGEEGFDADIFVDGESRHILGAYEVMQALQEEAKTLSPFARVLLEYTLNPPDFIERELEAQDAKLEHSKMVNEDLPTYRRKSPVNNIGFVAHCLMKTAESNGAKKFIKDAIKEVKRAVMQATM